MPLHHPAAHSFDFDRVAFTSSSPTKGRVGRKKGSKVVTVQERIDGVLKWRRMVVPPDEPIPVGAQTWRALSERGVTEVLRRAGGSKPTTRRRSSRGRKRLASSFESEEDADDVEDRSEGSIITYSPSDDDAESDGGQSVSSSLAPVHAPSVGMRTHIASTVAPAVPAAPAAALDGNEPSQSIMRIRLVGKVMPKPTPSAAPSSPTTLIMSTSASARPPQQQPATKRARTVPPPPPARHAVKAPAASRTRGPVKTTQPSRPPRAKSVATPATLPPSRMTTTTAFQPITPAPPRRKAPLRPNASAPSTDRHPVAAFTPGPRRPAVRPPSPAFSAASSDLIIVEDNDSVTPAASHATWGPPEATPEPDRVDFGGVLDGPRYFGGIAPSSDSSSSRSSDDDEVSRPDKDEDKSSDDGEDCVPSDAGGGVGQFDSLAHDEPKWHLSDIPPAPSTSSTSCFAQSNAPPTPAAILPPTTDEWLRHWTSQPPPPPIETQQCFPQQLQQPRPYFSQYSHGSTQARFQSSHPQDFNRPPMGSQQSYAQQPYADRAYTPAQTSLKATQQSLAEILASFISQVPAQEPPYNSPAYPPPPLATSSGSQVNDDPLAPEANPPVDSRLVISLERALKDLEERVRRAKQTRNQFQVVPELGRVERGIALVQAQWAELARALGGTDALSGIDLAKKLDAIRFWHLTQSALTETLQSIQAIFPLFHKYYALAPPRLDVAGPGNGPTLLPQAEYKSLAALCCHLTIFRDDFHQPVGHPFGADVYAFPQTRKFRTERIDWKGRLDQINWPKFSSDVLQRARTVVSLLSRSAPIDANSSATSSLPIVPPTQQAELSPSTEPELSRSASAATEGLSSSLAPSFLMTADGTASDFGHDPFDLLGGWGLSDFSFESTNDDAMALTGFNASSTSQSDWHSTTLQPASSSFGGLNFLSDD